MTVREPEVSDWHGEHSDGTPTSATRAPGPPSAPRYRLGGELGAGAMGQVRAAYDGLLERELAIKYVRATGDARAEAALLREARVTAGLEHPGIIAVLDAGVDEHDRPFYAMRVVHGESLAERVARAAPAERPALVRAVLQVAQAMAYAHARGVVHRDLSARNVRLGAHGEVVVMDWGLAATLDEAARVGAVCGTPGYRAPELERGQGAGPPADVWSVGALLHLVLVGAPPGRPVAARGAPAELRSLLARALATDPSARYADCGEFARDLAAYLDGQPVRAHRDRPWDRAWRLARRHPGLLAAVLGGVAAVALVAIVLGTLASRRADEAQRARDDAQRSRIEARTALARMVIEQGGAATRADRPDEALALARQARDLGADETAAAIEAAFAALPPVAVAPLADEAGCRTIDVGAAGTRLCLADGALWRERAGARVQVPHGGAAVSAARLFADGGVLVALQGTPPRLRRFDPQLAPLGEHEISGGGPSIIVRGDAAFVVAAQEVYALGPDGPPRAWRPCGASAPIRAFALLPAATAETPAAVVVCGDGVLRIEDGERSVSQHADALMASVPAIAAAVVVDGRVVLGGSDARIAVLDLASLRLLHVGASPVGAIRRLVAAPGGDVAVIGDDGVALWRPAIASTLHVAPASVASDAMSDGARLVVIGGGHRATWAPGAGTGTHRVAGYRGQSTLAWSPDGRQLAVGGGDLWVITPATGELRVRAVSEHVIKSIAFAPDGATLAVGIAGAPGLRVLDRASLVDQPGTEGDPALSVRRLAYLAADRLLLLRYSRIPSSHAVAGGGPRWLAPLPSFPNDVSTTMAGAVYVLGHGGDVTRFDGERPTALHAAPDAGAIASSADGSTVALVARDGGAIEVRAASSDQVRLRFVADGAAIEDAALDARGARLALGRVDGTVELWDLARRSRVLRLRAHAGRAAAVAFSPDGCTLASAGWDAVTRLFALCPDVPARSRR